MSVVKEFYELILYGFELSILLALFVSYFFMFNKDIKRKRSNNSKKIKYKIDRIILISLLFSILYILGMVYIQFSNKLFNKENYYNCFKAALGINLLSVLYILLMDIFVYIYIYI